MPVARKVWQLAAVPRPAAFTRRFDHPEHINPAHPPAGEPPRPRQGPPERRARLVGGPGRVQIGVERGLRLVMDRHSVVLAALLVEPQPPPLPLLVVVRDIHAAPRPRRARRSKTITASSARSRRSARSGPSIDASSPRASSGCSTGVLPVRTTCVGPRTDDAGFEGTTWPTTQ